MTARVKIGEKLVREGIIDLHQLSKAIEEHKKTGELMGSVLVRMGMVKEELLQSYLERQKHARDSRRLGEILVEEGLVSQEQLDSALEMSQRTNTKLGTVLVKRGFIKEPELLSYLGARMGVGLAHLDSADVPLSIRSILAEELCVQHRVFPLGVDGSRLRLAMVDPSDLKTIDIVRYKTSLEVEPFLTTDRDLDEAVERVYRRKEPLGRNTKDALVGSIEKIFEAQKSLVELQERVMQNQRLVMASVQEMLHLAKHRAQG